MYKHNLIMIVVMYWIGCTEWGRYVYDSVCVDVCVVLSDALCSMASRKSTRLMGTVPGVWL